jgi:hypothetical protein
MREKGGEKREERREKRREEKEMQVMQKPAIPGPSLYETSRNDKFQKVVQQQHGVLALASL